jgi:hypothetical protein
MTLLDANCRKRVSNYDGPRALGRNVVGKAPLPGGLAASYFPRIKGGLSGQVASQLLAAENP